MTEVQSAEVTKLRSSSRKQSEELTSEAIEENDFGGYQMAIMHDWLRTITTLAFILVPLFFVLDIFMTPHQLLVRFAIYRAASTLIALFQYMVVRKTKPSRWSFLHGYLMSIQVGATIALMTVDLGGFNSSYYAGLNLVIIGVNLLMPWRAEHTAINTLLIVGMYVGFNLIGSHAFILPNLINNLFFPLSSGTSAWRFSASVSRSCP